MKPPRSNTHESPGRRGRGFTLIELLVVVSIIALLISILLPSLRSAREQAKAVACLATQSSLARGCATYQADWNDWLPGSRGTSGSVLLGRDNWAWNERFIPSERIQVWDWATPLGLWKHLSNNRSERWQMVARELLCPANPFLSSPYKSDGEQTGPFPGWPIQPMMSYNTIRQYLYWADTFHPEIGGTTQLPTGYSPRITRVGHPSEHVFLSDSSRYTPDSGKPDHDINWSAKAGGGFSDGGPTLKASGTSEQQNYLRAFKIKPALAPLTYRHKRGKTLGIVVSFYDGSGKWMSEKQSRFPDPWWPKGTVIPASAEMNLPTYINAYPYLIDGNYTVPK